MIQARTYTCGAAGGVRKLTDLTGLWADVSLAVNGIPSGNLSELLDIATDPNDGDKVFVVGEGFANGSVNGSNNWFGIAVTTNGGSLWQIPTGNYIPVVQNADYYKWIEVSVVDSNTIYICGILVAGTSSAVIIKSTDGGASFNVCSPLPLACNAMDCTSIHFITPLIGVAGFNNVIIKTIDGGFTWTVMNGGGSVSTSNPFPNTPLLIGQITGIRISQNEGYIIAIGQDFILETTPVIFPAPPNSAGMAVDSWQKSFYPSPSGFGVPIGMHLTSLLADPSCPFVEYISVTGLAELGIYTYDYGVSWINTPTPGYQPSGIGFDRRAAHFFKPAVFPSACNSQSGFYNKANQLFYNPTGFDPNIEVLSDNAPYRINSVWTWYLETPDSPTCYLLTECTTGASIVTHTNLSASVGLTVTVSGYSGCYLVSQTSDCTGSVSVLIINTYQDCVTCKGPQPTCYLLTDCSDPSNSVITSDNLSLYVGQIIKLSTTGDTCWQVSVSNTCLESVVLNATITPFVDCVTCLQTCYLLTDCSNQFPQIITNTDLSNYVGSTITLSTYPTICWQVTISSVCTGFVPLNATIGSSVFTDCVSCQKQCYVLTDCKGEKPVIITDLDLSLYVDQVIKIVGCDTVCYIVTKSDTCIGSQTVELGSSYVTCQVCLAPPLPPPAPLKTRMVQPGYGEGVCSVDFVEKVNCNFSNQLYSKFISNKYGVNQCIDDEFDKYLIKKELLKLNLIFDPLYCVTPPPPVVCDPVVVIPPTPLPCLGPTEVVVTLIEPVPGECLEPVVENVTIVYQS